MDTLPIEVQSRIYEEVLQDSLPYIFAYINQVNRFARSVVLHSVLLAKQPAVWQRWTTLQPLLP